MSSPAKLLQLQNVYAASPVKFHTLESTASPSKTKKPNQRKPGGLSPLRKKNRCLSPRQLKQWIHEAQELNMSSSLFLETSSTEHIVQIVNEKLQLIMNPSVLDHKFALSMDERTSISPPIVTMKRSPAKMRMKLQAHLEEKIKGNIWDNEIRSRLARPLSASTFCARVEQLRHPLCGDQFIELKSPEFKDRPRFPYSLEAHESANCIRRCVLKAWFRIELKIRVRIVAIAIRVLRRRGVPLIIRGFRRRRRAAICIQRYYRRFSRWKSEFLRPFASKNVDIIVRQALKQVGARVLIARTLTALYLARKIALGIARQRARHLRRWAAKTRVSLFIHQIWTVCWFRNKRRTNVGGMKLELSLLESSDHNIHLKYGALFATPFGKDLLKKELGVWRVGARTKAAIKEKPNDNEDAQVGADPAIVRLRQCFQIFDLDGSGTLDLDEFQLMLSYLRGKKPDQPSKKPSQQPPKLSTAQIRSLFAELDQDGNGSITCCEFESWWTKEHERAVLSTSASTNFLTRGLDTLLLQSHGLLFWLLGRKQQLERKFVKKLIVRRAMEKVKLDILQQEIDRERVAGVLSGVFRCTACGRRFGLRRDLIEHIAHECNSTDLVVDTFILKRWMHEEEFRLLEDVTE
ncbi:hypothetical protein PHMEG_00019953 [Phytophthora megakarya]|uniref:Uncharacterized protein n=1 Tax=Phytophthora megakarya TaxID=4795 RepID=A0A225VSY2_9STRA|nr:hypothetical protein PHMEG_00019953 [Phytophthora megakarya]